MGDRTGCRPPRMRPNLRLGACVIPQVLNPRRYCQESSGLNKKPVIHSLLAARPSALRRPPRPSERPADAAGPASGHLRLVRDEGGHGESARRPEDPSGAATEPPIDPADAVQRASAALAGIHALVMDVLDRIGAGPRPRRRSPREICEIQALMDRAVRDVCRIVDISEIGGRRLFDGYFRIELPSATGGPPRRASIRSMRPEDLGPDAGRSLASLVTGGRFSLLVASIEDASAILQHVAGQIVMERRQLSALSAVPGARDAADDDVARENAAAAMNAQLDLDFAALSSHVTPGAALAAQLAHPGAGRDSDPPPPLTLRRS